MTDIDDIEQRFNHFVPSSDGLIFLIHQQRASAFSTCCQMDKKPNEHLLKKYVDAYGSSNEQDTIINECRVRLVNPDQLRCKLSLEKWDRIQALTIT
jgi:hypothetical protein